MCELLYNNKRYLTGRWGFLVSVFALLGIGYVPTVWACEFSGWTSKVGAVDTSSVRYQGDCGATGTAAGDYLQDTISPAVESYVVSFYSLARFVAPEGSATIFEAGGGGVSQLTLVINGDDTAELGVHGGSPPLLVGAINNSGTANGWNHYKVTWQHDGTVELFINGSSAGTSTLSGSGPIDSQTVGLLAATSLNGGIYIDYFFSGDADDPRTGLLCAGDTNASDTVDNADVNQIYTEFASFGITRTGGQPDYNGDGSVSFDDVLEVAANAGACNP